MLIDYLIIGKLELVDEKPILRNGFLTKNITKSKIEFKKITIQGKLLY